MRRRVLVLGAGGIGCEILTQLAEAREQVEVHVIDCDTIESSNLERQLLYCRQSVGKPKVAVAKEEIKCKYGKEIHAVFGKIEDQPDAFFSQFDYLLGALDNIAARRFVNLLLFRLGLQDMLWLDCGSEGHRGQVSVIRFGLNACFECMLPLYQSDDLHPLPYCTLISVPRNRGHCILWAIHVLWPKLSSEPFDPHKQEHLKIATERANERIQQYCLGNNLCMGEAMHLAQSAVPADVATNRTLARLCVNLMLNKTSQAFNFYTISCEENAEYQCSHLLEKDPRCFVCGATNRKEKIKIH